VGNSTGDYLLNVRLEPSQGPPRVLSVTPGNGAILTAPPTQLVVRFSEPINFRPLLFQNFDSNRPYQLQSVYVEDSQGTFRSVPRVESWDPVTNTATFLMLDGLPDGVYHLHLSSAGPVGLRDFADNPLVANDPSGDYVVTFTVRAPLRGVNGDPRQWVYTPPSGAQSVQSLGVLFPDELQGTGVTITRDFAVNPPTTASNQQDLYQFRVLQSREYIFFLGGSQLPNNVSLALFDSHGVRIQTASQALGQGVKAVLSAGTYVVRVSGWLPSLPSTASYRLTITLGGVEENPPPLTVGPAPVLSLRLVNGAPQGLTALPDRVTLSSSGGTGGAGAPTTQAPVFAGTLTRDLLALSEGPVAGARATSLGPSPGGNELAPVPGQDPFRLARIPRQVVFNQTASADAGGDKPNVVGLAKPPVSGAGAGGLPLDPGPLPSLDAGSPESSALARKGVASLPEFPEDSLDPPPDGKPALPGTGETETASLGGWLGTAMLTAVLAPLMPVAMLLSRKWIASRRSSPRLVSSNFGCPSRPDSIQKGGRG
jgi:hypothetical protein